MYPETAQYWDYEENAPYTPDDVYGQSGQEFWWVDEHGRKWRSVIAIEVTREKHHIPKRLGRCAGVIKGENTLDITHPHIAAMWHPTKNGELYPDDVIAESTRYAWWLDPKCGHAWRQKINEVAKRGHCPCKNQHTRLLVIGFNDVASKRPDLIPMWSEKNIDKPDQVIATSKDNIVWNCPLGEEWEEAPVTKCRSPKLCPIQAQRKEPPCRGNKKTCPLRT